MVSYRLDGISGTRAHSVGHPVSQSPRTISEYIAETRMIVDAHQHPVAVFDDEGQPVFRNSALAARLTAEQQSPSSPRAWQFVYATACRTVADSISSRTAICSVIPVHQRTFVLLGNFLRQASGTVYGVTVNLAEVSSAGAKTASAGFETQSSVRRRVDSGDEAYSSWMKRRDEARTRMQRLSPRETEVVMRVSAGLPNKSIARELEISVKTIEKHRANAVRKLGVQSTPEMVGIAVLADVVKQAGKRTFIDRASRRPAQPRFVSGLQSVQ